MDSLGPRLRRLRSARGLSQRRLATQAGVSNATISLIESGRTDPSMGLMKRILDAMEISFADFFAADHQAGARHVFRHDELTRISDGPITYLQVGGELGPGQPQIMYERYAPGADTGRSMLRHDAEEGGIVISGRLELTIGDRAETLTAGDGYLFNSRLPHRFRNSGNEECTIVSACTPPTF